MSRNVIILDNGMDGTGVPVNLDFVMKIICGAQIKPTGGGPPSPAQAKTVFIYHGIPGSATISGATTALKFASANLAVAAYNRLLQALDDLGYVGRDLRKVAVKLASITPASTAAGVAVALALVGDGFTQNGQITINATTPVTVPIVWTDGQHIAFTLDATIPAGTYDVEYTEPNGNAARLAASLTLT